MKRHCTWVMHKSLRKKTFTVTKVCLLKTATLEMYWDELTYSRTWRSVRYWSAYDFATDKYKGSLEERGGQNKNSCGPRNKTTLSTVTPGRGWYKLANIPDVCRSTMLALKMWEKWATSAYFLWSLYCWGEHALVEEKMLYLSLW